MKIAKLVQTLLGLVLLQACGASHSVSSLSATIRIKGSDTMVILAQRWADEFMQRHSGVAVYVEGGGSATGIEALIKGQVDISTASRPLRASEARRLADTHHSVGLATLVARDALSVYLNPENPVRNLSLAQVQGIFTGKVTNWREVGGNEGEIVVLSRSPNSGTYLYFQEHVLEEQDYVASAVVMPTTAAIVAAIEKNSHAIGYGGLAYGQQLVHCNINGVAPTEENVRKETYPIARYLYFYTIRKPEGVVKLFIDWVVSPVGQRVAQESNYLPLMNLK